CFPPNMFSAWIDLGGDGQPDALKIDSWSNSYKLYKRIRSGTWPFTLAADTVTLQWASVGALRDNEAYQVTIEDATGGTGRKLTQYVTDTKFIVPVTFRPQDNSSHIMRWWVVAVRQTVADDQGNPIWSTAGAASAMRVFGWSGAGPAATPTK
ncbi:MAG: hypothetical protein NTW99_14640, partial [Chloroflexi bacterium]|nr:hypothetical protein [Chloroflexota bacterium]